MKVLVCLLLIFPFLLSAQLNESDSLKLKAKLSVTGFYQGGNVETFIFRAKSDFKYKAFDKWVFKTQNSYVYQEFGKEKADEDFLTLNFVYLNPDKKFYPLVLGIASSNFRRKIDLRSLVGAGVTYQALDKKKNWLKLSLSSEYEQTNFLETDFNIDDYDDSKNISTFRGTIWVNGKYHLFNEKLVLSHEFYFQPSLEKEDNYRWQADLGLELPVWDFLSFKVNYMHTFESIVIEGQEREDQVLTFGLTLKSY
jgi:hypothetical protein